MIVRKLPNISKRWPPQKNQNDIHSQPNPPHSNTQNKPPYNWKYKHKQQTTPVNIPQSVTTTQLPAAQPPHINFRSHTSNSTPSIHTYNTGINSRKSSNISNTSFLSESSNTSNTSNTSNLSNNFRRRNVHKNTSNKLYSQAAQQPAGYTGLHRKLHSAAYTHTSTKKPPRPRNISNHCVNKPLPPVPNMDQNTSSTNTNGYRPRSNKNNKRNIGYYNNTSIRKGGNKDKNVFSDYNTPPENPPQMYHSASSATHLTKKVNRSFSNDTRRRLYELFARDKLIKWIYKSNTGIYEPIFVVTEHYGSNDGIIGRDARGIYHLYNRNDIEEAPPYDHDVILINAVEQLLRGYQHRFKATSLRKDKVVEIIKQSKGGWIGSGSADAIFGKVIGFENTRGDVTNVILQDKDHNTKHAFPVLNIKEKHILNIETNDKVYTGDTTRTRTNKRGSIAQYVTPSYWLNGEQKQHNVNRIEDEKKKKQEHELLQQIERMKNVTKKLQDEIANKINVIESVDLMDKVDKKGIAVLNAMWNQVLQRNKRLQIEIKGQKNEIDSWRNIATEHNNENRLLKLQMTSLKTCSKNLIDPQDTEKTQLLQRELRLSLVEHKQKENTIRSLEEQNNVLQKQLLDLDRKTKMMKSKVEQIAKIKKTQQHQITINEDKESTVPRDIQQLAPIKSRQKRTVSNYSSHSDHIQRGGGMLIDSNFLTVKDTLIEYQSLRDQSYHNLHIELKKTLKENKGKTWHKSYINCICHEFMFLVLQLSYKCIGRYNNSIYQQIGQTLCIDKVVSNKQKQNNKMDYVFHFYLQENHEILFMDFKNKKMENLIENTKQIYHKKTEMYLSAEGYVLLTRYLDKCCSVCWFMILQRPKLTLFPKEFKPMMKSVAFDSDKHSKSIGSDRKSSYVLYYVWPTVKRGDERLGVNIQAIVRDNDVPMTKKRK